MGRKSKLIKDLKNNKIPRDKLLKNSYSKTDYIYSFTQHYKSLIKKIRHEQKNNCAGVVHKDLKN